MERTNEYNIPEWKRRYWRDWFSQSSSLIGYQGGSLIEKGHMQLGAIAKQRNVEGKLWNIAVEIEADIEWWGSGVRVIIQEGSEMRYTTRLTKKDGMWWRVMDKTATLKVWNSIDLRYEIVILCEQRFKTPQEFATWFYTSAYKRSRKLTQRVAVTA